MTKEDFARLLEERKSNMVAYREREDKERAMIDEIKLELFDHATKVSADHGDTVYITSAHQLGKVKKIVKEKTFASMDTAPNVGWAGKTNDTYLSLGKKFEDREDIIRLDYTIYVKDPDNGLFNWLTVRWVMLEKELPEEFTRKGCHFKETVYQAPKSVTKAFVCEHQGGVR